MGVFSVEADLSPSPTSTEVIPSSGAVSQFTRPVLPPEFVPQLVRVFATGYLVCVAGLFLWWVVGVAFLIRMIRVGRPADEATQSLLREIAGDRADRVRLVITGEARQPVACRAYGQVIMLPDSLVENGSRQELRFALAHEWSRIERGDWWLWSLANLIRAAFLFHPASWSRYGFARISSPMCEPSID
jgi:beta-lactamase regulating signal transducer with metallopeptidase domain